MKYIKLSILSIIILNFLSCTVTTEKYTYQLRLNSFYNLLNNDEETLFAENKLEELAKSLSSRINNNEKLLKEYNKIKEYEAILSFTDYEFVYYFRNILLKELNKPQYLKFCNSLGSNEQKAFFFNDNMNNILNNFYEKNNNFRNIINEAIKEYKLTKFNKEQIYKYYRDVLFKEFSQKEVYHFFKLLNDLKLFNEFIDSNDINQVATAFEKNLKTNTKALLEFNEIKKRSAINKLSIYDYIYLYKNIVSKEMDSYALKLTIEKFYNKATK